MNFRDYAKRIRSQAEAAAKKLPTFDDMAAKDEYIHSEEFNVRGQPRPSNKPRATTAKSPSMDPDETSSMGSWSLLDRPPAAQLRSSVPAAGAKDNKLEISSTQVSLQGGGAESMTISTNTSVSSEAPSASKRRLSHSSSTLPLLSVVASALEENYNDSINNADALDSGESNSDGDSSDSILDSDPEDDAENDPILSMIRKNKPSAKQRSSTKAKGKKDARPEISKKSSQRFMQDLDERIATPGEELMEAGLASQSKELSPSAAGTVKGPLGGWMQNMAKAKFNRILGRPEPLPAPVAAVKSPPLVRERPLTSKTTPSPAEEYHQASAVSILGDDELAQLAKLKSSSSGGACSRVYGAIQEYRSFAFILFTLLLAFYLYLFQQSADEVS